MRNKNKFLVTLAVTLLSVSHMTTVLAEKAANGGPLLDRGKFSIGAGISFNSVNGVRDDEVGFQFFGAYDLTNVNLMEGVHSSIEFGYMDYGFSGTDSDGIWTTYVVDGGISDDLGWLGRLGFDLGDDSGLMLGAGFSYAINNQLVTRLEYVARDDVGSIQFNILYNM